eukprot:8877515-Pyramimonas_sp.AAC.1
MNALGDSRANARKLAPVANSGNTRRAMLPNIATHVCALDDLGPMSGHELTCCRTPRPAGQSETWNISS